MDNAQKIWNRLICAQEPPLRGNDRSGGLPSAQLTPAGAAGLLGNLYAESGLNPMNLQNSYEKKLGYTDVDYTAAVDCGDYDRFVSDRAGYGLAQWTHPSRKAALLACAKARDVSIGDLDMQVGYLLQELQKLFPALWRLLLTTDSVRAASDAVLLQFERPADRSETNCVRRAAVSQAFFDKYNGAGGDNQLKLLKCILTENECYQTGTKVNPRGVMVHSTGANNPTLRRYVQPAASAPDRAELLAQLGANHNSNHWNQFRPGGQQVCVHAFVGKLADGSVAAVQTLPWNHRGWHCGSGKKGSGNDTYISFEICEDGLTDPVYFAQAYRAAVELTAYLCKQYKLNPLADGVVICHQDGYQRGIASNHGDIYNWFPKHGKTMDDFRADVVREMNSEGEDDMKYYEKLVDVPAWYQPTVEKLVKAGVLNGTGDGVLNVSEDFCRVMTVMDRLGKLD